MTELKEVSVFIRLKEASGTPVLGGARQVIISPATCWVEFKDGRNYIFLRSDILFIKWEKLPDEK